jgi:hypothetical protein
VSWPEQRVTVDLKRQALRAAPPYDSSVPLDHNRELRIFKHYGLAGYWRAKKRKATHESNG